MKNYALLLIVSFSSFLVSAQNKEEKVEKVQNKIETIKIINGDTVLHDVRIVDGDLREDRAHNHRRLKHRSEEVEFSEDANEILKDIDVYVNLDDAKKEMIVKRLSRDDDEFEMIIENWSTEDDMVIDMKDGKKVVKVIKIEIDEENGEQVTTIKKVENKKKSRVEESSENGSRGHGREQGIGVFPNPAKDKINVTFVVLNDNPAELIITNVDGKQIFKNTYDKKGQVSEVIGIEKEKKGLYVITLTDRNRTISRKIIIE